MREHTGRTLHSLGAVSWPAPLFSPPLHLTKIGGSTPSQPRAGTLADDDIRRTEAAQELKAKKFDFLPFAELEQAVRDDIDFIRGSKLVPPQVVLSGWIYEVETGRTRRVV